MLLGSGDTGLVVLSTTLGRVVYAASRSNFVCNTVTGGPRIHLIMRPSLGAASVAPRPLSVRHVPPIFSKQESRRNF